MDISNFKDQHILVIGDIILERYWSGHSSRISPEAPVPVVHYKKTEFKLAGTANLVANLRGLGAKVSFISLGVHIDSDSLENYHQCLNELDKLSLIHLELLPYLDDISEHIRIFASDHQMLNIDNSKKRYLNNTQKKIFIKKVKEVLEKDQTIDKIIISDYGLGAVFETTELIALAKQYKKISLIDPYINTNISSKFNSSNLAYINKCQDADYLILNNQQMNLLKLEQEDIMDYIANNILSSALLVTSGKKGMKLIFNAKYKDVGTLEQIALENELSDISGVGDVVCASFALCAKNNVNYNDILKFTNAACGSAVRKIGISLVDIVESQLAYADLYYNYEYNFLRKIQEIKAKQLENKKIVFTNGCFDVFHIGHLTYLKKAKDAGDILVLAVNSDESIKKLKGDLRPVNNLQARMDVLQELEFVDYVLPFYEDTPCNFIEYFKPDVLVKGTDYKESEIIGADIVKKYGGQIAIIAHEYNDISSSKIIEKIN
tara:strand:- start:2460 stop:3932 length:1473 start_codon:yes stop_codon:yes gene_type:complete